MKNLVFISLVVMFSCAEQVDETEEIIDQIEIVEEEIEEPVSIPREYKEYHENGQLKIEGMNDDNGLRTGIWTSYYADGKKWSESHYIRGLKEGHSVTFYENGNIRYIGEYKKDKQFGEWTFYNEEGEETERKTYD